MSVQLPPVMVSHLIPIDLLNPNESGRVVEITGPESWKHRLQEFGLREGIHVRMVKRGEPCILAVDGQRFSLRADKSAMILVEPASAC